MISCITHRTGDNAKHILGSQIVVPGAPAELGPESPLFASMSASK